MEGSIVRLLKGAVIGLVVALMWFSTTGKGLADTIHTPVDEIEWEAGVTAVDGRIESCDLEFSLFVIVTSRLHIINGYIGVIASEPDPTNLLVISVIAPNDKGVLSLVKSQNAWLTIPRMDTRHYERHSSEALMVYKASSSDRDSFSLGTDIADGGMLGFLVGGSEDEIVVRIPRANVSQPFQDYAACIDAVKRDRS